MLKKQWFIPYGLSFIILNWIIDKLQILVVQHPDIGMSEIRVLYK